MDQHSFPIIIIILALAFGIYRRIKRNVGWQPLNLHRIWIRTIIFLIIGCLFFLGGVTHPVNLISDVVGIAIGGVLAYYGSIHTQYEARGDNWYYQPNKWIGGFVTVLFLGRLVYRFYEMYKMGMFSGDFANTQSSPNTFNQMSLYSGPSWTSGLYLIMFAYYAFFFILLIRKSKNLSKPESND